MDKNKQMSPRSPLGVPRRVLRRPVHMLLLLYPTSSSPFLVPSKLYLRPPREELSQGRAPPQARRVGARARQVRRTRGKEVVGGLEQAREAVDIEAREGDEDEDPVEPGEEEEAELESAKG